jgi:hypothetical protein
LGCRSFVDGGFIARDTGEPAARHINCYHLAWPRTFGNNVPHFLAAISRKHKRCFVPSSSPDGNFNTEGRYSERRVGRFPRCWHATEVMLRGCIQVRFSCLLQGFVRKRKKCYVCFRFSKEQHRAQVSSQPGLNRSKTFTNLCGSDFLQDLPEIFDGFAFVCKRRVSSYKSSESS